MYNQKWDYLPGVGTHNDGHQYYPESSAVDGGRIHALCFV